MATWTTWAVAALQQTAQVELFARARPGLVGAIPVSGRSFGRRAGWHMLRAAWTRVLQADAVLAVQWHCATRIGPLARELHVVLHGSEVMGGVCPALRELGRRAQLWGVSDALTTAAREQGLSCRTLPIPIPWSRFRVREPDRGDPWLFVGRATGLKGGDRFVRLARAAGQPASMIGAGPMTGHWRLLAPDVEVLGARPLEETHARISAAGTVFLLSRTRPDGTHAEGLGLTLLEAAALGIPTVGTNTGGIPEVAGLVLDDADDVEASVHAIRSWWRPSRGLETRERLRTRHGPQAFLSALSS